MSVTQSVDEKIQRERKRINDRAILFHSNWKLSLALIEATYMNITKIPPRKIKNKIGGIHEEDSEIILQV